MIKLLVKNLSSNNEELQMHSASVIYKVIGLKYISQKDPRGGGLPLTSPSGRPLAVWLCSAQETNRRVTSCPSTTASSRWSPC